MHLDKTVARVLLIFSIASVVLAAPASVRQRHLTTDPADDEPMDESEQAHGLLAEPVHQPESEVLPEAPPSVGSPDGTDLLSLGDSTLDWLDGFFQHLPSQSPSHPYYYPPDSPEPPSGMSHQDLVPVSGAPESHGDVPLVSEGPGSHAVPFPWWLHTAERPPAQFEVGGSSSSSSHMESGAPGGGGGSAPALGAQSLQDLIPVTNIDQAARLDSWLSSVSAWSADDMRFHRSFE